MTDFYVRLDYRQYKHLEDQLRRWEELETSHTTVDGFYHKALRIEVGDTTFEFQGPAVKEPIRDTPSGTDSPDPRLPIVAEWVSQALLKRARVKHEFAWDVPALLAELDGLVTPTEGTDQK